MSLFFLARNESEVFHGLAWPLQKGKWAPGQATGPANGFTNKLKIGEKDYGTD